MADADPRPPSAILSALRAKSKLIVHLQGRADRREFKSVNDAIALQKARRDRERLRDELPPFTATSSPRACRDCHFYRTEPNNGNGPFCGFAENDDIVGLVQTTLARENEYLCGASGKVFQPKA
jgi:hypothetical protein